MIWATAFRSEEIDSYYVVRFMPKSLRIKSAWTSTILLARAGYFREKRSELTPDYWLLCVSRLVWAIYGGCWLVESVLASGCRLGRCLHSHLDMGRG